MMGFLNPVDKSSAVDGGKDRSIALRQLCGLSDSKAKFVVFLVENGAVEIASGNPAPRQYELI
jgi:hypothetical protein